LLPVSWNGSASRSIDKFDAIANGTINVTASTPRDVLVRLAVDAGCAKMAQQVVVAVDHERGVSFFRG
jgi:hypothetical protein